MEKRRSSSAIFSCPPARPSSGSYFHSWWILEQFLQPHARGSFVRCSRSRRRRGLEPGVSQAGRSRWRLGRYVGRHRARRSAAGPNASRYNLDLKRVIAAGHSAGGQLALWLAAQMAVDLRGVVPLAAISDLRRAYALQLDGGVVGQLLGGSPEQRAAALCGRFSAGTAAHLSAAARGARHGGQRGSVRYERAIRQGVRRTPSSIPLPGAGHFDLIDPRTKFWPIVQKNILDWQF